VGEGEGQMVKEGRRRRRAVRRRRRRGSPSDRILCDVPCSGDGTMRKAPDIWRKW